MKIHEFLSKVELTPSDIEITHNFKGSHSHTLNEVVLHLNKRVSSIFDFYKSFFYDPVKEMVSSPSGHVPGVDSFLDSFVKNYTNNKEFCGSFIISLCKVYTMKVDEISLAIMLFDSSSLVEQTYDKFSSTNNSSDLLLFVEKLCKIGICFVPIISVLAG